MKSKVIHNPTLRRWLPWALYASALLVTIPLTRVVVASGGAVAVAEDRKVTLSAPRPGGKVLRVKEILVIPGQVVTEGQVLARMDSREFDSELEAARHEMKQYELAVTALEAKLNDEEAIAHHRLSSESDQASLELTRLVMEAQRDRAELAQLNALIAQEEQLVADKLSTLEQVNKLKLRRAVVEKQVANSRAMLTQARQRAGGASQRVASYRKGTAKASKAARAVAEPAREAQAAQVAAQQIAAQLAPARAQAEVYRSRVKQLEIARDSCDLRSPFAGRVADVLLRPGEMAMDGPVLSVAEEHPKTAVAYIDERWATRVEMGTRVRLVPRDGGGRAIGGRVVALGPNVAMLPPRFWVVSSQPRYGRTAQIELDSNAPLAGQLFDASFSKDAGAKGSLLSKGAALLSRNRDNGQ